MIILGDTEFDNKKKYMNIGEVVETFRRKRKIKQVELAKEVGITQSHLSMIEGNKTAASIGTLTEIAKVLGIPVQLLMVYSLSPNQMPDSKKEVYYKLMPLITEIIDEHFLHDKIEKK